MCYNRNNVASLWGESMARQERLALIDEIEKGTDSRVLVYACGDWPVSGARIADDAVWPIHDHLRKLSAAKRIKRLALFIYSIGGVSETPWKIVSTIREFCDEFHVIVPYKCYSAATMIALGADKIVMGKKGELGPIDPSIMIEGTPAKPMLLKDVGVEDISSYIGFLKNRVGLTDQTALSSAVGILAEHLTPPLLGRIDRIYSHSRLVARKLLSLHNPPLDDTKVSAIIESLTEKSYSHGHAIGRKEAKQLGLDVEDMEEKVEEQCWTLLETYAAPLRLRDTADPGSFFPDELVNRHVMPQTVGVVESKELLHSFAGQLELQRVRAMPAQLNINVQIPLNIPNVQANQLPAALQQALQQIVQQGAQQLQLLVQQEIARQAPVQGVQARLAGGRWIEGQDF
jgi:hypothetical protein